MSLSLAEQLDLDSCVVVPDRRLHYGEERLNAYGYIDGVLYAFTYTERGDDVRAISLRRSREKELRKWTPR